MFNDTTALTIIIVNWNGGAKLLRCLSSIRASRTSFPVKVIVVDNDSRDGSREQAALKFPEYRIVNTGSNLGFGRGNNYARPWVDTPLVLFLNPDTELFPDTLEKAVQSLLARPRIGVLGCQMRDPDGTVQEIWLQWFRTPWRVFLELLIPGWLRRGLPSPYLRQDPLKSGQVLKLCGGFMLIRKEVLDAAGWFDERYFMYAEDEDLSRTIRALGWELFYDADCAIIHASGGPTEKGPSGFSVLMQQRSVNQLITKYQGSFAGWRHRIAVGLAAGVRLLGLRLIALFIGIDSNSGRYQTALQRSRLLWQWARQRREAVIPAISISQDTPVEISVTHLTKNP